MSEQLAKAIADLQAAVVALDLAETQYLKFADFSTPPEQIAWAQFHKPVLQAAERRVVLACEALKAAGWKKPRGLLPEPREQFVDQPATERPADAHAESPHQPDQHLDQ